MRCWGYKEGLGWGSRSNWWRSMEAKERLLPDGTHRRKELMSGKLLRSGRPKIQEDWRVDPSEGHSKGSAWVPRVRKSWADNYPAFSLQSTFHYLHTDGFPLSVPTPERIPLCLHQRLIYWRTSKKVLKTISCFHYMTLCGCSLMYVKSPTHKPKEWVLGTKWVSSIPLNLMEKSNKIYKLADYKICMLVVTLLLCHLLLLFL